MDYEKMYKAVLKTATQWIEDGCSDKVKTCLECIFPELRESEDERIRVRLIEYFKGFLEGFEDCYKDGGNVKWEGLDVKSILAWLKKQKEQKPTDYPYLPGWRKNRDNNKPKLKRSVLMLTTHGVAEGEWLGEKWCQYRWSCELKDDEVLYWMHLSDLERLEKEGEKHTEPEDVSASTMIPSCWTEKQKEPGIKWLKSDNVKNPDKPYVDKAGMFYTTDGRMCYASEIEQQKEQKVDIDKLRRDIYQSGYNDGYQHGKEDAQKEHFRDATKMVEQKPVDYNAELKKCKDNPLYFYDKYVSIKQKPVEYLSKDKVYAIMTKLTNLSYSNLIPLNSNEYKKINEITSDIRSLLDYPIEQKPNIELIQKSWYMEGYHDKEFNCEPKWIIKTGEGGPRYEENPKYGQIIEQKPAEWDDYTKTNLGRAIQIIKDARGTLHGYQTDDGIYECDKAIEALEHFLYRGLEIEKSAEWSEEDKHNLNSVINLVHATTDGAWGSCIGDRIKNWLKNLPKRFNLSSKQEWSEEDESMLNRIIETLSLPPIYDTKACAKMVSWLESLRPSWKPSEEQMEALEYVIRDYREDSCNATANYLQEILDHLKNM